MDGFGTKSYKNISEAIEKSKSVKMESFLVSLGIPQIGTGGAKRMAKYFGNDIDLLFDAVLSNHDLSNIEDFGEITASSVYEYFQNKDNMKQVKELLEIRN